ncbi:MAG: zinc ribbon domain-containing protein [Thermoanaerobaculia bacterium]
MPTFDFTCDSCGRCFEDIVPASAVPACPTCGSAETRKRPSGFAVGRSGGGGRKPSPAPGGG